MVSPRIQPTDCSAGGGVILLNYDFKMEILLSKKPEHTDGLSRSIPKYSEQLEDTVLEGLKAEI